MCWLSEAVIQHTYDTYKMPAEKMVMPTKCLWFDRLQLLGRLDSYGQCWANAGKDS